MRGIARLPRFLELISTSSSSNLLHERLELSKLVQQRLVHDVGDVFDVVVDLVIALQSLRWNTWINALQDTKSSKVLQSDLKLPQSRGSSDELCVWTHLPRLHFLSHTRKLSLRTELRSNISLDGLLLLSTFHSLAHVVWLLWFSSNGIIVMDCNGCIGWTHLHCHSIILSFIRIISLLFHGISQVLFVRECP